jgi:hypothetical protein
MFRTGIKYCNYILTLCIEIFLIHKAQACVQEFLHYI